MKWIAAVLCILTFTLPSFGQTTAYATDLDGTNPPTTNSKLPNSLTAVAIGWHYDAQQQMLTLHLAGGKNFVIEARNLSADG